ncbi:hypothetical protein [Amaricoccus solimangrovi]|uniref:Uncharacterized protein n=1 Tax=Amaricoccus solimangrovi TaxID=2589815 RepID=A0A501WNB2_9RHOB|nr:hypothetical protein [Amaricoccus solimangrovi]TPE47226.1 hypothetical protein FJM51_20440 [Amaricoccus solimangrovi]
MALRLADLTQPREIALGYGVTVTMTGIGFVDLRSAEAMAFQQARREIEAALDATALTSGDATARAERDARIAARSEEIIFDRLAARHITGWSGVLEEDGRTPAPFTPDTWATFRDMAPWLADRIRTEMRMPALLLVAEGNVSPP